MTHPYVEPLEDRTVPTFLNIAPVTPLHYTPGGNFSAGAYNTVGDPGALGFSLVAVSDPNQLAQVPQGDRALVWLGLTDGVDANFVTTVRPYIGDPRVFGFYVADEPQPGVVPAANLKAESDWIHANDPGAKTFFVSPGAYSFYTPTNTDMDFVGLDPYPMRTYGVNYWYIPYAVLSTEEAGWSPDQIVPVYQAFGGAGIFAQPTPEESEIELAVWSLYVPSPAFDYAFSWYPWGAVSLAERPDLQEVFHEHNTLPQTNPVVLWESLVVRAEQLLTTWEKMATH